MVTGRLLVVCKQAQTLEVIDLASGETAGSNRASALKPHEVVATPDGALAFLPIYSDVFLGEPGTDGRAIDVVDLVGLTVTDRIELDFASRPHLPLLGADGRLYVGTELDESVSVFDPASGTRVARLPTGRPQSHMFVLSPDGARAYSSNVDTGTVSVIDVASETLVDVIEVAGKIQRISVSPDGSTVFTADQESPRLAAIDAASHEISWIELPSPGFGTSVTPDGSTVVVALRRTSQLGLIDRSSRTLKRVVDVPAQPQAIVIHPEGDFAYSACDEADQVVEVDLRAGTVSRVFDTGSQPDGICWAPVPVQ